MTRINLLPPEHRPPRPLNVADYLLATVVFFVFFTITSYYNGVYTRIKAYREEIEVNRVQIEQLGPGMERVRLLTETEKQASTKASALTKLEGPRWAGLLPELGELTPNGVRFTEITADAGDKVTIRGRAQSLADLSQLVFGLGGSRYWERTSFRFAKAPSGIYEFEITGQLKPVPGGE